MIMKVLAGSLATSLLDPRVCLVGASGGVYRFFIAIVIIVFLITVVIVLLERGPDHQPAGNAGQTLLHTVLLLTHHTITRYDRLSLLVSRSKS